MFTKYGLFLYFIPTIWECLSLRPCTSQLRPVQMYLDCAGVHAVGQFIQVPGFLMLVGIHHVAVMLQCSRVGGYVIGLSIPPQSMYYGLNGSVHKGKGRFFKT